VTRNTQKTDPNRSSVFLGVFGHTFAGTIAGTIFRKNGSNQLSTLEFRWNDLAPLGAISGSFSGVPIYRIVPLLFP
jgi:hypothetical protein